MGDQLGYYRDLAAHGPTTPAELAARTGDRAPYAREWLNAQAAGRFVEYDAGQRSLHAAAGAGGGPDRREQPGVPARFLPDRARHGPRLAPRGRRRPHRAGLGWHEHNDDVHEGCERFFRPGYAANLVSAWLPALDGVVDEARGGGPRRRHGLRLRRVDDADGAGVPALDVRRARTTTPSPSRPPATRAAPPASPTGPASRSRGHAVRRASGYDLVTMFDCLHDMGDPVGAARHVRDDDRRRRHLDDRRAGRRRPGRGQPEPGRPGLLRVLDAAVHAGLAVPAGGLALGTQAGPARIREVVTEAGFTRFRLAAQTPFNNVYEVRP